MPSSNTAAVTETEKLSVSELERVAMHGIDAWNANDWEALEALAWPDAVVVAPEGWPEQEDIVGWPAIRRQFERLKESLQGEHVEVDSMQIEDDRVLAQVIWSGTGEGSGLEIRLPMWMLTTYRGQRYTRIEYYLEEEKARASWDAGTSA